MSLAKVSGPDFSRAFLHQVEHGQAQPSTRVLRVIAGRLGTEVDYLLERLPVIIEKLRANAPVDEAAESSIAVSSGSEVP